VFEGFCDGLGVLGSQNGNSFKRKKHDLLSVTAQPEKKWARSWFARETRKKREMGRSFSGEGLVSQFPLNCKGGGRIQGSPKEKMSGQFSPGRERLQNERYHTQKSN